jgi:hypothetical protein
MAVITFAMHNRLLSFLTDVEKALVADDPAPSDGSWEAARTVNYHLGLARLMLGVRLPEGGKTDPRGTILLQSYQLADGTPCLKAALSWTGSDRNTVRSLFTKPEVDWTREARKIAAEWMAGPPAKAETPAEAALDTPALSTSQEQIAATG